MSVQQFQSGVIWDAQPSALERILGAVEGWGMELKDLVRSFRNIVFLTPARSTPETTSWSTTETTARLTPWSRAWTPSRSTAESTPWWKASTPAKWTAYVRNEITVCSMYI